MDNGLWPHVAPDPPPGAPYVSGLFPSPMPQEPAAQDAWWKVDGVMSSVLLEKLAPSVRMLAPSSTGVSRVAAREIYYWILQRYGLNDYSTFAAMETELFRTSCSQVSVQEYTRNWLEKLGVMRSSTFSIDERRFLNMFALGLPATDPNYVPLVSAITNAVNTGRYVDITSAIADAQQIELRVRSQNQSRQAYHQTRKGNARSQGGSSASTPTGNPTSSTNQPTSTSKFHCSNCQSTTHDAADCFRPGGVMEGKEEEVRARKREARAAKKATTAPAPRHTAAIASTIPPAASAPTQPHQDSAPPAHVPTPTPTSAPAPAPPPAGKAGGAPVPSGHHASFAMINKNIAADLYFAAPALAPGGHDSDGQAPRLPKSESALAPLLDQFNALLDSGCSNHMFHDRALFWDFDDSDDFRVSVGTANCGEFRSQGGGSVKFVVVYGDAEVTLSLKGCLFCPDLPINLLSVGALLEKGVETHFVAGPSCIVSFPEAFTVPELRGLNLQTTMVHRLPFLYLHFVTPPIVEYIERPPTTAIASVAASPHLWHRRVAHAGMDSVRELLNHDYAVGVKTAGRFLTEPCTSCVVGKRPQRPYDHFGHRASELLELLHGDYAGPFPTLTPDKKRYALIIVDDYSNLCHVALTATRSGEETLAVFKTMQAAWELAASTSTHTRKIRRIRFDGAPELTKGALGDYLTSIGVAFQETVAYAHSQNGKAERFVRTIEDTIQTLLADSDLPASYWGYAALYAAHVRNRIPTTTLPRNMTPYERFYGAKPDLSLLRVFGCLCFPIIPKELRKKGDMMRYPAIFIGFREGTLGWVVISLDGKKTTTRDAIFYENVPGRLRSPKSPSDSLPYITREILNDTSPSSHDPSVIPFLSDRDSPVTDKVSRLVSQRDERIRSLRPRPLQVSKFAFSYLSSTSILTLLSYESSSSLSFDSSFETSLFDFEPDVILVHALLSTHADRTRFHNPRVKFYDLSRPPRTFWEATAREDSTIWDGAMGREVVSLRKRGAFRPCLLPEGRKALPLNWVYAIKGDGTAKARLTARGDLQDPADYPGPVYAPVATMNTIRQGLAFATIRDWEIKSFDVKTAFLHAPLTSEVYCKQIPGYPEKDPILVLKLCVALYGLRESAYEFYTFLDAIMVRIGFKHLDIEHAVWLAVFVESPDPESVPMPVDGSPIIIIVPVHVDDGLVITNVPEAHVWLVRRMVECGIEVVDMGDAVIYLGVRITRDRASRRLWLSQEGYVSDVLAQYNLLDCKPNRVPLKASVHTIATSEPDASDPTPAFRDDDHLKKEYQTIVGILSYLATTTRPDIAFAAMSLGQYNSKPNLQLFKAAKGVLRYLAGTRTYAIAYPASRARIDGDPSYRRAPTCGMSDADWASDESERKSVSGYCFFYEDCLVAWSAVRQRAVALSSTEAEYYSLAHAMRHGLWYRLVLTALDLPFPSPFPFYVDNQSTLHLASSDVVSTRSKHIDVRYHFIRDLLRSDLFVTHWCPSALMTADIFTKPLSFPIFSVLRDDLGLSPLPLLSV